MEVEVTVRSLELRTQETKSGKTFFWQKVGMEQDSDWPVVFELFRPDGKALGLGKHRVQLAFQSSQYNQLEVNPFNTMVVSQK